MYLLAVHPNFVWWKSNLQISNEPTLLRQGTQIFENIIQTPGTRFAWIKWKRFFTIVPKQSLPLLYTNWTKIHWYAFIKNENVSDLTSSTVKLFYLMIHLRRGPLQSLLIPWWKGHVVTFVLKGRAHFVTLVPWYNA